MFRCYVSFRELKANRMEGGCCESAKKGTLKYITSTSQIRAYTNWGRCHLAVQLLRFPLHDSHTWIKEGNLIIKVKINFQGRSKSTFTGTRNIFDQPEITWSDSVKIWRAPYNVTDHGSQSVNLRMHWFLHTKLKVGPYPG